MEAAQQEIINTFKFIKDNVALDIQKNFSKAAEDMSKGVLDALNRRGQAQEGDDPAGALANSAMLLNQAADKLNQIPTEFQINGNHEVIVKIQGAQAFSVIEENMRELVINATNQQIGRFARRLQDGRNPVEAAGAA